MTHIRITGYARERMRQRGIPEAAVRMVIENYHTSRPAPFRAGARPAIIYIGDYQSRPLKVLVVRDSDPPEVTTVVWEGD